MFYWTDALIIVIIAIYVFDGYRQGFLRIIFDLFGVVLAFFVALKYYTVAGTLFAGWGIAANLSKPVGFFSLWVVTQVFFYLVTFLIFRFIPDFINHNKVNKVLGAITGVAKGIIIVAIFLIMLLTLPISSETKSKLSKSFLSGYLVKQTAQIGSQMDKVVGQLNNSLGFLGMVTQNNGDTAKLDFQTTEGKIDESSEIDMLISINEERKKAGLEELKSDLLLRNVARAQCRDMLLKGYFAHVNPAGESPSDRLLLAGVKFNLNGENLALAPTEQIAFIGLMNSPKHRDNILDPQYRKVGIGVLDAGQYGKIFTQEFTD